MASIRKSNDPRAEEWARRRAAGETLEMIGKDVGLTRERVRQVIRDAGLAEWVEESRQRARRERELAEAEAERERIRRERLGLSESRYGPGTKYVTRHSNPRHSREDAVAAVREWLENGGSGRPSDYASASRPVSYATIQTRWGWREIVEAAGGSVSYAPRARRSDFVTREEALRDVIEFFLDENVTSFGAWSYDKWAKNSGPSATRRPNAHKYLSLAAVRMRWGTWRAAREEAQRRIREAYGLTEGDEESA